MCRCHLSYTFMYAPGTKMTKNNTQFQYSGWKGKAVLVPPSDNNVPWKWALPLPRRWILHYYKLQIIHLQRAIFETCDLWDICSEWWENMTWEKDNKQQRAIFETFDLWDICSEWWENMTWRTKIQRQRLKQRQKQRQTKTMTNTFREYLQRAIFETCGLWDICSE